MLGPTLHPLAPCLLTSQQPFVTVGVQPVGAAQLGRSGDRGGGVEAAVGDGGRGAAREGSCRTDAEQVDGEGWGRRARRCGAAGTGGGDQGLEGGRRLGFLGGWKGSGREKWGAGGKDGEGKWEKRSLVRLNSLRRGNLSHHTALREEIE